LELLETVGSAPILDQFTPLLPCADALESHEDGRRCAALSGFEREIRSSSQEPKICEVDVQALSDRWVIAIGGSAVMLLIGTVYSWAIFAQPLVVGFGWDLTTTTRAYAIANFSLATVGVVVGGFWLDRKGPRQVAMTGVALCGAGNVLAGLGTPVFGAPWLYLTYGLIGGVSAGMPYITPLAVVSKWFPERRGLAGGLVVGSFGRGAFVYNQFILRLPSSMPSGASSGAGFPTASVASGPSPPCSRSRPSRFSGSAEFTLPHRPWPASPSFFSAAAEVSEPCPPTAPNASARGTWG
jgi:MFS family permease